HGTGMAGAIAARRNLLGIAPQVGLLTVRAFGMRGNDAEGTTFNILKGLDWAAAQNARVVNMSFAGPSHPRPRDALQKASPEAWCWSRPPAMRVPARRRSIRRPIPM